MAPPSIPRELDSRTIRQHERMEFLNRHSGNRPGGEWRNLLTAVGIRPRKYPSPGEGCVEESPAKHGSNERKIVWGGLAARCSQCAWKRVYRPGETFHKLPDEDLSKTINAEFGQHDCGSFPIKSSAVD